MVCSTEPLGRVRWQVTLGAEAVSDTEVRVRPSTLHPVSVNSEPAHLTLDRTYTSLPHTRNSHDPKPHCQVRLSLLGTSAAPGSPKLPFPTPSLGLPLLFPLPFGSFSILYYDGDLRVARPPIRFGVSLIVSVFPELRWTALRPGDQDSARLLGDQHA